MTYRVVILDFDGTLADSAAWFRHQLPRLAKAHGFRAPDAEELEALRGVGSREIMKALRIPMWKLPAIGQDLRRRADRAAQFIAPFPGVADMLSGLDRVGVKVVVVSSNSEWTIREVLGAGPGACVSRFVCGVAMFGKAARFRQVVRALKVQPHEVLAIGDDLRDLDAARKAGVAAGAVAWGYTTPEALSVAGPDHLFETPAEIGALFADRPAQPKLSAPHVRRRRTPA